MKSIICVVHKDQVFVPVMGKTRHGVFLYTDTMFSSAIEVDAIAASIDKVEEIGNPTLSDDYRETINAEIVKAIGSKVVSRWVKKGAMTSVLSYNKTEVTLAFNLLQSTEPCGIDFANALHYPIGTPSPVFAEAIITEWRRRNL